MLPCCRSRKMFSLLPVWPFFLNLVIIPSETLIFRNDQIMHGSLSSSPYSFTLLLCPPYAFPLPQLTRPTWCSRSAVTPSAEPVLSYVRPLGTVVMFFCFVLFLHRRVVIVFLSFFLFRSARDAMVCGTLEGW